MTSVLVTGAGGFCGHHFIDHFLKNTDWTIYAVTRTSFPVRVTNSLYYQACADRVIFIEHDLTNAVPDGLVEKMSGVDYVINLAGLSHVEDSIIDPVQFINTNVAIMINMLEFVRKIKPKKFIQFSTDEIYGPMINKIAHKEWDSILPVNPYSGSKAAQESLSIAYWKTYEVPIIITNTMTVIGERQGSEKFLTRVVNAVLEESVIEIHSKNGVAGSRSYLHARNAADAVLFILNNVRAIGPAESLVPERFNLVSGVSLTNLEFGLLIADIIGKDLTYKMIDVHSVRPGQDQEYGLNGDKLAGLGYTFPVDFYASLRNTVQWMVRPENRRFLSL